MYPTVGSVYVCMCVCLCLCVFHACMFCVVVCVSQCLGLFECAARFYK